MSSSDAVRCRGVPDFGPLLQRHRLVEAVANSGPRLVLLCAPSGYGKTVLAAQVAGSERFQTSFWVQLAPQASDINSVLWSVADVVSKPVECSSSQNENADVQRLFERIETGLSPHRSGAIALILDDFRVNGEVGFLTRLVDLVRTLGGDGSLVVVTGRDVPAVGIGEVCVFEADDVRLTDEEAAEFVGRFAALDLDETQKRAIIEACGGQAALLSVLARHPSAVRRGAGDRREPAFDLRALLTRLQDEQLDESQKDLLFAATLLREGTEDDLRGVLDEASVADLVHVSDCVPLVRIGCAGESTTMRFSVHDLAVDIFLQSRSDIGMGEFDPGSQALRVLCERGDYERALQLVSAYGTKHEMADWLEKHGTRLVERGRWTLVSDALHSLDSIILVRRPRLLLLHAKVLAATSAVDEALRKAAAASRLASYEGDTPTAAEAELVMAIVHHYAGRSVEAIECLRSALHSSEEACLPEQTRVEAHARCAAALTQVGCLEEASRELELARSAIADRDACESAECCVAVVSMYLRAVQGRMSEALRCLDGLPGSKGIDCVQRAVVLGDKASLLCETGRIRESERLLDQCFELCASYDLPGIRYSFLDIRAANLATFGEYARSRELLEESIDGCLNHDRPLWAHHNLTYASSILRAAGDADDALDAAERSMEYFSAAGTPPFEHLAALEVAANVLALGDSGSAVRTAKGVRKWAHQVGALHHLIRADLILAEADRRNGDVAAGVARLTRQREYIAGGDATWLIAMYIRAFPGLLEMLTEAMGEAGVPSRLARLVPAHLLLRDPSADSSLTEGAVSGESRSSRAAVCRVQFFGGLSVTTPDGPVPDRAWRKRKARLLFAMLVAHRGKDVPRDQILDYLWPEMEEDRARNNLYVVWSVMKRALVPGAQKSETCPYVESVRGLCRSVTGVVQTDLDEFDDTVSAARKAEAAGDTESALSCYGRLRNVYVGDLLPGDVYDDWFAPLREQYRHEFSDCMLKAAELHAELGEWAEALACVRRALAFDAWREDLYQAAMRFQIRAGQRSAAVETYVACRSRLAEDLGLDPSSDTRRLYEQVLAMEEA